MKPDPELLLAILKEVASRPPGPRGVSLPGVRRDRLADHVRWLWHSGYLDVLSFEDHDGQALRPVRLTSEGEEYLETLQDGPPEGGPS